MNWRDIAAEILETALRLFPVRARTGLRIVGNPGRMSPVFLTGNYDLTVRRVLRAIRGLDAYLVVADSKGVNVWCASSGGLLTTHQVVTALKLARLEEKVAHREVVVPQLAATGVEGKEVRRRSGWIVRFGPADAKDIPAYLAAGKQKTREMREVRFETRERLEMAVAWAVPISVLAAPAAWLWGHVAGVLALVWSLAVAVFLLYDRLPGPEALRRLVGGSVAVAAVLLLIGLAGGEGVDFFGWGVATLLVFGILTFDYAGSSPTEPAGLFEERHFRVVLDFDRCAGAYNCWAVCPEAVFEKHPTERKVVVARENRCIRCGACIVQCPQDALAFEGPDGRLIGPEVIRRYKLNLLGKRVPVSEPEM